MARRRRPPARSTTTPPAGDAAWRLSIEPDYRGHRIGVDAKLIAGEWHVEIRIRRILSDAKPVVVSYRWPPTVPEPERRGLLFGKTWVKRHRPSA